MKRLLLILGCVGLVLVLGACDPYYPLDVSTSDGGSSSMGDTGVMSNNISTAVVTPANAPSGSTSFDTINVTAQDLDPSTGATLDEVHTVYSATVDSNGLTNTTPATAQPQVSNYTTLGETSYWITRNHYDACFFGYCEFGFGFTSSVTAKYFYPWGYTQLVSGWFSVPRSTNNGADVSPYNYVGHSSIWTDGWHYYSWVAQPWSARSGLWARFTVNVGFNLVWTSYVNEYETFHIHSDGGWYAEAGAEGQ